MTPRKNVGLDNQAHDASSHNCTKIAEKQCQNWKILKLQDTRLRAFSVAHVYNDYIQSTLIMPYQCTSLYIVHKSIGGGI